MDKVEQIKNEINKLIIPESKCSNISLMDNGRQYAYREVMEIIESLQDDTETDFGKKPVTKQSVEDVIAEIKEKSKAFTSLEQSKMLAEILPIESADMHYNNGSCRGVDYTEHFSAELMPYQEALYLMKIHKTNFMFQVIPCWSLAALLDILPPIEGFRPIIDLDINSIKYEGNYRDELCFNGNNLVDVCYEMIWKLHEQKLL